MKGSRSKMPRRLLTLLAATSALASAAAPAWLPVADPAVRLTPEGMEWKVVSRTGDEFSIESAQQYPASSGGAFEVRVRIRGDLSTKALPELVCYDGA